METITLLITIGLIIYSLIITIYNNYLRDDAGYNERIIIDLMGEIEILKGSKDD